MRKAEQWPTFELTKDTALIVVAAALSTFDAWSVVYMEVRTASIDLFFDLETFSLRMLL